MEVKNNMNTYRYFDTHAHLYMKDYDEDREELIENLKKENIGVIVVGVDKKTSLEAVALANRHENIFAVVGCHPKDSKENFEEPFFAELVKDPKVVAIGECGLEFFRLGEDERVKKERQIFLFKNQIDFAIKYKKPLVVHCREAHSEVLEIFERKKTSAGNGLRGVIHFFSGDIETAKRYLDLGFYLSFGGVLTFTDDYNEVVKFIPLERILSETDAPFVAPVPYRGQRNSSLYVKEVVKKISEIKQIGLEEVEKTLIQNTFKAFSLT